MIHIITDTLSCLSPQEAAVLGVDLLPQVVIFNDNESYHDDYEITHEQFLARLVTANLLPKTSAPSPSLYTPIYTERLKKYDTLIVILPSEKLSGTLRSATIAANDFVGKDIRFFDTCLLGPSQGAMVHCALQWVQQGDDADTIMNKLSEMRDRQATFFLVDTLEYLHKNGRIGLAKALLGSVLEIKPILSLAEGRIIPAESQRTKKRALARLKELVVNQYPKNREGFLTISHANASQLAQELAEAFATELDLPCLPTIHNLPPAILVHAGPGAICVQFFR